MKIYNTGKRKWEYGARYKYAGKMAPNILLGPCPICGGLTVSQGNEGKEWWCRGDDKTCINRLHPDDSPYPDWWNTDINVQLDGNAWCATGNGFINLQEPPAGFGDLVAIVVCSCYLIQKRVLKDMARGRTQIRTVSNHDTSRDK